MSNSFDKFTEFTQLLEACATQVWLHRRDPRDSDSIVESVLRLSGTDNFKIVTGAYRKRVDEINKLLQESVMIMRFVNKTPKTLKDMTQSHELHSFRAGWAAACYEGLFENTATKSMEDITSEIKAFKEREDALNSFIEFDRFFNTSYQIAFSTMPEDDREAVKTLIAERKAAVKKFMDCVIDESSKKKSSEELFALYERSVEADQVIKSICARVDDQKREAEEAERKKFMESNALRAQSRLIAYSITPVMDVRVIPYSIYWDKVKSILGESNCVTTKEKDSELMNILPQNVIIEEILYERQSVGSTKVLCIAINGHIDIPNLPEMCKEICENAQVDMNFKSNGDYKIVVDYLGRRYSVSSNIAYPATLESHIRSVAYAAKRRREESENAEKANDQLTISSEN